MKKLKKKKPDFSKPKPIEQILTSGGQFNLNCSSDSFFRSNECGTIRAYKF